MHPIRTMAGTLCLLSLNASGLSAQGLSLQASAGFAVVDDHWNKEHWSYGSEGGVDVNITAQLGATWAFTADHKARLLLSGLAGNLSNQQVSLDYQYSVYRWSNRAVYVFAGPSLNFVSGNYRFATGSPQVWGDDDRRYVDQRWRPGLKLGAGLQWTKNLAVEVDAHAVNLATSGFQSVPRSTTSYIAILMSYRLPVK